MTFDPDSEKVGYRWERLDPRSEMPNPSPGKLDPDSVLHDPSQEKFSRRWESLDPSPGKLNPSSETLNPRSEKPFPSREKLNPRRGVGFNALISNGSSDFFPDSLPLVYHSWGYCHQLHVWPDEIVICRHPFAIWRHAKPG
ncbi:hypothetical protein [Prosthecobacter sp.]|uniref:hypothetical protein n=1 Tax=Prosthecobacter sp. TaxID=1965333 RepID=UPI002ABCE021|nr:hypothetical protein [Prosthecobacter sp.]MDZ4401580.1 hypothetical protein [Prosthecobacter sp.]